MAKMTLIEFIKKHAPMTYQSWLVYEQTTCCNHRCNQGRDCPARNAS